MANGFKSLREVVLEFPRTFIDTSALFTYFDGRPEKGDYTPEAKVLRSHLALDSAIFFREFLEGGGGFYVIQDILEEYKSGDYVSRKQKILDEEGRLPRNEFELFRVRQREDEEKEELIKMLESRGLVYTLSDGEQDEFNYLKLSDGEQDEFNYLKLSDGEQDEYNFLKDRYSYLRHTGLIGKVDFKLLIFVAAVSKKGKACLISGDGGILAYCRLIGIKERISPEFFGFFVREGRDVFQRENYVLKKKRRR